MSGEEIRKYGSLGDRFGEDYVDRVKGDGRQDGNKYSRKELASEFRYGRGDTSVDDTVAKYQDMVDSGKFKGNNKARGFLEMHGVDFGDKGREEVSIPVSTPTMNADSIVTGDVTSGPIEINTGSDPGLMASAERSPSGIFQDNDQVSNIVGNNNTSFLNQDNSIIREVDPVDPMEFKKYFMNKTFA